jgi:chromosome segregation ATPase
MSEDPTQHFQNGDLRFIRERLDSIDSRLATLEDRVDRRLQETRPIWESVLEQLKDMNVRQAKIENENKDFRRVSLSLFGPVAGPGRP